MGMRRVPQRSISDFADVVKVVLYSLDAQKEDYGAYCDRVGIRRPYFWFGAGRQPRPSRGGEMRGWLPSRELRLSTYDPSGELNMMLPLLLTYIFV